VKEFDLQENVEELEQTVAGLRQRLGRWRMALAKIDQLHEDDPRVQRILDDFVRIQGVDK
jgi:hypothetical protein